MYNNYTNIFSIYKLNLLVADFKIIRIACATFWPFADNNCIRSEHFVFYYRLIPMIINTLRKWHVLRNCKA